MRVDTIEKFKELLSKGHTDIYALPTGNNIRHDKGKVTHFRIVSCGKKYVKLATDEQLRHTNTYCPKRGCTQEAQNTGYGGNAGYMFFDSEDAIEKYKYYSACKDRIQKFFGYGTGVRLLSEEDIDIIIGIIDRVESYDK